MKQILTALLIALFFIGCNSDSSENVQSKLIVTHNLSSLKLNDQNGKTQIIKPDTKKIVFAFSKDVGHNCNEFFATKPETYLEENKVQFIADISSAPSLIRSMFIMPGLKEFKHTVLIIDDEKISAEYKPATNNEKIVVADIKNQTITNLTYLDSVDELQKYIAK